MAKNKQGSAHVVAIICLVAALATALGWIFWQNFVHKTKDTTNLSSNAARSEDSKEVTEEAGKESLKTINMNNIFSPGVSFSYPSDWSERETNSGTIPISDEGTTQQSYILSSADKTVDLTISLLIGGGLGGACDESIEPKLEHFSSTQSSSLSDYAYAEAIYKNRYDKDSWGVIQGLGPKKGTDETHTGDTSCKLMFMFTSSLAKAGSYAQTPVLSTKLSKHGVDSNLYFRTLDDAKAYLASDNAMKIKNTLLSVK